MRIRVIGSGMTHIAMSAMAFGYASDIYAEFGVNNAVIAGGSTQSEHEENMLSLDVRARDGDDAITIEVPKEGLEEGQEEEQEEEEEGSDESGPESGDETPLLIEEFVPGQPDEELKAVSESISKHAEGFNQMRESAIANGLEAGVADAIMTEYGSEEGISDKSYEALAKAGFNRQFVESYIRGQEALSDQFVSGVINLAGGAERFNSLVKHMETNSPSSLNSLYKAMEGQDLDTITSIIDLTKGSLTKKFGKAPGRNITKNAPASQPEVAQKGPKVEPFADRQEMIAAMSKPEYSKDPKYRAQVEARVALSF